MRLVEMAGDVALYGVGWGRAAAPAPAATCISTGAGKAVTQSANSSWAQVATTSAPRRRESADNDYGDFGDFGDDAGFVDYFGGDDRGVESTALDRRLSARVVI